MQREIDPDSAVVCAVEAAHGAARFLHGVHGLVFGRVEHRHAVREVRLRAGFAESARFHIEVEIHVRRAGDAEAQHFGRAQQRAPINGFLIEMAFEGENARGKPVLQLEVFAIAAHERHGGVAVAVVKGGHEQPVRAANGFAVVFFGALRAEIGDPFALRGDIIMRAQPFGQEH